MKKPKVEAVRGELRNRIVGSGTLAPEKLLANPLNWRGHPRRQEEAVEGALEEVGWVQDVIVNRRSGRMIDGHLRVKIAKRRKERRVPVKYVDLSPEEERVIMATLDPTTEMAEVDGEKLRPLLAQITVGSIALQKMLAGLEESIGVENAGGDNEVLFDQAVQMEPGREYIVVLCANETEWDALRERLKLRTVRRGGYKKGSAFDATAVERVIPAARFLKLKGGANAHRGSKQGKAERRTNSSHSAGRDGLRPGGRGAG